MKKLQDSLKTVKKVDENELIKELNRYKEIKLERQIKYQKSLEELQTLETKIKLEKKNQQAGAHDGLSLRKIEINLNTYSKLNSKLLVRLEFELKELRASEERINFVELKFKELLNEKKAFENYFEDKDSAERVLKQIKMDEGE